jgi:ATP adenylyltransferase
MKNLWAPWRGEYVTGSKADTCIFCRAKESGEGLVLTSERLCFAVMNRFPYTTGHCMVAPSRHVGDLTELSDDELARIMAMTQSILKAIRKEMNPDGFNVGFNLGSVAGAGIADHIHLHVVPRWKGDTNFMPVLSEVHIISEHIEKTYEKIKRHLT